MKTKKCEVCGKSFIPKQGGKKYCSSACRIKANNLRAAKEREKNKLPLPICKNCGKSFEKKAAGQRYCSEECRAEFREKNRVQRKGRAPQLCVFCGKEFVPNSNGQKYCTKACKGKAALLRNKKPEYRYDKNERKKEEISPQPKLNKSQQRLKKMSWKEIDAECLRLHISYGQVQVMALRDELPEDFGRKGNKTCE